MPLPTLGVVVVTFNASDVILEALESLMAARDVALEVVVVDNGSTDDTLALIRSWAAGETAFEVPADCPFPLQAAPKPVTLHGPEAAFAAKEGVHLTLIETGTNSGFAGGVNVGLAHLAQRPEIDRFWVLNPDSSVPPQTPAAFATHPAPDGGFALISGRVVYYDTPDMIQIDGGTLNTKTGVTGNIGLGAAFSQTPPPEASELDFVTGASLVASRRFYDQVGPMEESYFLYYEEVDWALRRGDLPLLHCPNALVYHKAGTAIGSPTLGRPASPFSLYFKYRARMRFLRRFYPRSILWGWAYSLAKAGQLAIKGYVREAWTILVASADAQAPAYVRQVLSPQAAQHAFGAKDSHDRTNAGS